MAIQEKLITAEEFWDIAHAPEYADKRIELVEGEICVMSPTGGKHGKIAGNVFGFIWSFVKQHQLGDVTAAETGYHLAPHTVRAPDAGFVASARAPEGLPAGFIPFAPDLAVEVVSPGNTASEIHTKVMDYLGAGTKIVWVVYPDSQTVVVHTPEGAYTHKLDATLDGGAVLLEFALPVRDIFS